MYGRDNAARFGTGGGTLSPVWRTIKAADFVALTAYKNPHDVATGAISVDDSTGEVTFALQSDTTAWDGSTEGAAWRTKLATAAYGWRGDGTQAVAVKFTPSSNPGVATKPLIAAGFVDQDGDTTDADAKVIHEGFGWANATNFAICTILPSGGSLNATANIAYSAGSAHSVTVATHPRSDSALVPRACPSRFW